MEKDFNLLEKISEKTFEHTIGWIKDFFDKKSLIRRLNKALKLRKREFANCLREEEFDFEALKAYILEGFKSEGTAYLTGTKIQRKAAYETILEKAFEWAKAKNPKAKEKVKLIVDEALDIIRTFYREKIDVSSLILAAEVEDTIAANVDSINVQEKSQIHLTVQPNRFFVHREGMLAKMTEVLEKDGALVLSGMGGIGKTGLAKQYAAMNKDRYKTEVIIPSKESIKIGLIKNAYAFGISRLSNDESEDSLCERVLAEIMKAEPASILLIFDDASPDDILLNRINALDQHKLLTGRSNKSEWSCQVLEIEALESIDEQKDLFEKYLDRSLKPEEIEDFTAIATAVKGHTLTLQLLALTMIKSACSLYKLRTTIENAGLYREDSNLFKYGDCKEERNMYGHISAIWNMSEFSKEESAVIQALSLIAPNEIGMEELSKWIELENYNSINGLIERGWINSSYKAKGTEIYLHSVIAEVIYRELYLKNPMNFPNMEKALIKTVNDRNLPYGEQMRYNAYGVSFGKRYLTAKPAIYILNLAALQLEYFRRLDEAFKLLEIAETRLKELKNRDAALEGHTFNNHAVVCQTSRRYTEAIKYYYMSIDSYKSAEPPLSGNVGYSLHNIARTYYFSGNYTMAMKVEDEAEELIEKHNKSKLGEVYDLKRELYYMDEKMDLAYRYGKAAIAAKLEYNSEDKEQYWRSVLDFVKVKVLVEDDYDYMEDCNEALEFFANTAGEDSRQAAYVREIIRQAESIG